MAANFIIRNLRPDEWDEVAVLIHRSTNDWYRKNLNREIFGAEPMDCRIFPEVYEALDPSCCLVAVDVASDRICGSCFYHPRESHWSLGIMNAAPENRGVAKGLLAEICRLADKAGKPLRLVSSAANLDSFSLYSRAGFVPVRVYQDLILNVPEGGMNAALRPELVSRVRPADMNDVPAIVKLEAEISGLGREKDHRFFIANEQCIWSTLVIDSLTENRIDGVLTSVTHPGSRLLGPGIFRDADSALALVWSQLDGFHRGFSPVWLAPADDNDLINEFYRWGARNCEIHLAQVRGDSPSPRGLIFPTFMPETG